MILHYLKIAFRNLWKYKLQSLISIIGLAVGFVCFAVSLLWIHYERSYDDFHDGAERMYIVGQKSDRPEDAGVTLITPFPLAEYLKQNFPEVEEACNTSTSKIFIKVNDVVHDVSNAEADSLFMKMFHVELLAGNLDFLIAQNKKTAITEALSKTLFGDTDPIGQTITLMYQGDYTVGAIIKDQSQHTKFPFQILTTARPLNIWHVATVHTIIKLKKGVDEKAFASKLSEHIFKVDDNNTTRDYRITSLTSLRYQHPPSVPEVAYKHIFLFAIAGGLVLICAILNYITLFVCRFRIRIREFSLRMVCGATGLTLFALLITEFAITLLIALLSGGLLVQLILFAFQRLSNVHMSLREIYLTALPPVAFVVSVAVLVFSLVLVIFRRRALNRSILKVNHNLFRKASIVAQLVISIGFIFCTSVMMKQIYMLQHTDIGIDYRNKAEISTFPHVDNEALKSQLLQIPEITEAINIYSLIPRSVRWALTVKEWEDMPKSDETQHFEVIGITDDYLKYYNFRLLDGEMLTENESPENILITESGAKMLGWKQPVGKTVTIKQEEGVFSIENEVYTIKGVVKDIHVLSPTVRPKPTLLMQEDQIGYFRKYKSNSIDISYREGQWEQCRKKIEALIKQSYPNTLLQLTNVEDKYREYIKSETALIKLLGFVSFVCVIISIFGFVSLISLTCEERRKEIAIRKINGAIVRDILFMYFKEYFLLLVTGALIAFPTAYLIMKRWIEQYMQQTAISVWIYLSILALLGCIIVLCIGGRVAQVARENPAEAVKSNDS